MQATLFRDQPAASYLPSNVSECVSCLVQSVRLPACVANLWPAGSAGLSLALNAKGTKFSETPAGPLGPLYPSYYSDVPQDTVFVGSPSGHVLDMVLFLSPLSWFPPRTTCMHLQPVQPP